MNETLVTLVGNAATGVEYRDTATGGMARFRFAVTPRRWDREKQLWTDGHTSFYTVWAWRALASNLSGSVAVGEPLVVHGRLKIREDEREGRRRTSVDVEAVAVGHDLTRGTAAFRRVVRVGPGIGMRAAGAVADGPGGSDAASARSGEPDWSGGAPGWGAVPVPGEGPGSAGSPGAGERTWQGGPAERNGTSGQAAQGEYSAQMAQMKQMELPGQANRAERVDSVKHEKRDEWVKSTKTVKKVEPVERSGEAERVESMG